MIPSVSKKLKIEKAKYLDKAGTKGGTSKGFRDYIRERCDADPTLFPYDGLRDEAATKAWEDVPRTRGPDLFSIGGEPVAEFLTRPQRSFDGDFDDENQFEKVAQHHATVADLRDDALIKMRKAAQASAAAERQMQRADLARRRAKGDESAFLRDIADE